MYWLIRDFAWSLSDCFDWTIVTNGIRRYKTRCRPWNSRPFCYVILTSSMQLLSASRTSRSATCRADSLSYDDPTSIREILSPSSTVGHLFVAIVAWLVCFTVYYIYIYIYIYILHLNQTDGCPDVCWWACSLSDPTILINARGSPVGIVYGQNYDGIWSSSNLWLSFLINENNLGKCFRTNCEVRNVFCIDIILTILGEEW